MDNLKASLTLKPSTVKLIESFRNRREGYLPKRQRRLRKEAADNIRYRFKVWGKSFTRMHESSLCCFREHLLIYNRGMIGADLCDATIVD